MMVSSEPLSNPVLALALRAILGGYVIFMSRRFYADPTGYFRKAMRGTVDLRWMAPVIRGLSCFCLWGGCFIVATAIAVQVLRLHGDLLGPGLVGVAALATWLLIPREPAPGVQNPPNGEGRRGLR